jgi:hypothetical protein
LKTTYIRKCRFKKLDITFTECKMSLLQKGPKYNLHAKQENWSLEAETAISQLPTPDQDVYMKLVAEHITALQNNNHQPTHHTHPEARTVKTIQLKLKSNNAMIAQAVKGNSLVILPIQHYESKVHNFLQANKFQTTSSDPQQPNKPKSGKQYITAKHSFHRTPNGDTLT